MSQNATQRVLPILCKSLLWTGFQLPETSIIILCYSRYQCHLFQKLDRRVLPKTVYVMVSKARWIKLSFLKGIFTTTTFILIIIHAHTYWHKGIMIKDLHFNWMIQCTNTSTDKIPILGNIYNRSLWSVLSWRQRDIFKELDLTKCMELDR